MNDSESRKDGGRAFCPECDLGINACTCELEYAQRCYECGAVLEWNDGETEGIIEGRCPNPKCSLGDDVQTDSYQGDV